MKKRISFYKQVECCKQCELRKKAVDYLRKEIKLSDGAEFTLYSLPDGKKRQPYMFIMQNPGMGRKKDYKKEIDDIKNAKGGLEKVNQFKRYLIVWLKKNSNFMTNFLNLLKKYQLITFDDVNAYIEDRFLKDFYVTDLVKCRADTNWLGTNRKRGEIDPSVCFNKFLKEEITKVKPKLIFLFSSRAWDVFKKIYNLSTEKLKNAHGNLFKIKDGAYIIPLAHFSQRQFNNYLRDSYFDYLEEGIKAYTSKK